MARMGMESKDRPRVKLECLRLLTRLRLTPVRARFLSGFIDTYLRLSVQETLLFQEQTDRLLNRTERNKVMELTTSWKEEGRQEGRQEGRVDVVLRQLQRGCGPLGPALESEVRSLSPSQLQALAVALLDFASLTDLKRWLARR